MKKLNEIDKSSIHKSLLELKKSPLKKYMEIFLGKKSFWKLVRYECIIFLFSWIPGAAGLFLRKIFYPIILKEVGRGVAFGHHITIRHPHKISIGDHSFVDDFAVLDAKGESTLGITIKKNVIIGRNTILSCKGGSIFLNDFSNISSNCCLLSETNISIGKYTFLAGHCYLVAGGNHSFERTDIPIMFQPSIRKDGIKIGDDCWLGARVTVIDGIKLGKGCVVGAGSVVTKSFSDYDIALGNPAWKIKSRKQESKI
jgi:acetyltransferase-like isoleucine patch superfamily enzyme